MRLLRLHNLAYLERLVRGRPRGDRGRALRRLQAGDPRRCAALAGGGSSRRAPHRDRPHCVWELMKSSSDLIWSGIVVLDQVGVLARVGGQQDDRGDHRGQRARSRAGCRSRCRAAWRRERRGLASAGRPPGGGAARAGRRGRRAGDRGRLGSACGGSPRSASVVTPASARVGASARRRPAAPDRRAPGPQRRRRARGRSSSAAPGSPSSERSTAVDRVSRHRRGRRSWAAGARSLSRRIASSARVVPSHGQAPGQELVDDDAERVHVGGRASASSPRACSGAR